MTTTTEEIKASPPGPAEFVNVKDLRVMFGISRSTAYEWEAKGYIEKFTVRERGRKGGKCLWVVDSVRAYLNSFRQAK